MDRLFNGMKSLVWLVAPLRPSLLLNCADRQSDTCEGTWRAIAVGDSCIFQVRDEQLNASFPITEPGAFGHSPPLVPSKPVDPKNSLIG